MNATYRRLRRENPYMPARHALAMARLLDLRDEWTERAEDAADGSTSWTVGPLTYTARIEPDDATLDADELGAWTNDADAGTIPYRHSDRWTTTRHYRPPEGMTLRELTDWYRRLGASRSVARADAVAAIRRLADRLDDAGTHGLDIVCARIDVSADGLPIDRAAVCGVSLDTDRWADRIAYLADTLRDLAAELDPAAMIERAAERIAAERARLDTIAATIGAPTP